MFSSLFIPGVSSSLLRAACRLPDRGILRPVMTGRFYHDSTISLPVQVFSRKKGALGSQAAASVSEMLTDVSGSYFHNIEKDRRTNAVQRSLRL